MQVKLIYQPYGENMAIFIDGNPIGAISALSKYQTRPFSKWCNVILNEIATEVNDSFDVIYAGRKCECDMLANTIAKCPLCKSIRYEAPMLSETALNRLKKLEHLGLSGVMTSRSRETLWVYTDIEAGEVEAALQKALPRLAFCRIALEVQPLSRAIESGDRSASLIVAGSKAALGKNELSHVFGAVVLDETRAKCEDGVFLYPGQRDNLSQALANLLEMGYYPALLKKALANTTVSERSSLYPEVLVLDKIEPMIIVKVPQSIEYGETVDLKISTIPRTSEKPEIRCRISNEGIVTYKNGKLTAVGTGEAYIEVYEEGKTVPLLSTKVVAYRRNRVSELKLQPKSLQMCVGEERRLECSYAPQNADNVQEIRLASEDGTIAGTRGWDRVIGKRAGSCNVYLQAEKVTSSGCVVTVYPALERLELHLDQTEMVINSLNKLKIIRHPAEATLDELSVQVEPPSLGTYDMGSESFFARCAGSGQLVVRSKRNGVTASIPITVRKKPLVSLKQVLIGAGIAAGSVILWLVFR